MARSALIRALAFILVSISSCGVSLLLPIRNRGMFQSAPFLLSKSLIVKPLSARARSPLCNLSSSPDCIVISRSEIEHSNASDINPKVV